MKAIAVLPALVALMLPASTDLIAQGPTKKSPANQSPAKRTPRITVSDLGAHGGMDTFALDINNHGAIAAVAGTPTGTMNTGLFWSAATGFVEIAPGLSATPSAINDHGQIAGVYAPSVHDSGRGFLWDVRDRAVVDLGEFYPSDINNRGEILGFCPNGAEGQEQTSSYCVYDDGDLYVIPIGSGTPMDINDRGIVVGILWEPAIRGFAWSRRGGLRLLEVPDGMDFNYAIAVNDKGNILGFSGDSAGNETVTLWQRGVASLLPAVPAFSFLGVLNDRNWFLRGLDREVWVEGAVPIVLPSPADAENVAVTNLNDRGNVVGFAYLDGQYHMFVWTVRP